MSLLVGQYLAKLTQKDRLAVPSKFRNNLGNRLIVAKWYEGCLVVVSEEKWNSLLDKLTGKKEVLTQSVRDTERFILGSAYDVELDSQGRFIVPKKLLAYASIKDKAVFVGLGNRVEIWEEASWETKETQVQKDSASMLESLAEANEKLS